MVPRNIAVRRYNSCAPIQGSLESTINIMMIPVNISGQRMVQGAVYNAQDNKHINHLRDQISESIFSIFFRNKIEHEKKNVSHV